MRTYDLRAAFAAPATAILVVLAAATAFLPRTAHSHDKLGANLSGGVPFISNDNWQDAANAAEITATGRAPTNAFESAILIELPPGNYTAVVDSGTPGGTGIGIIEVYAQ